MFAGSLFFCDLMFLMPTPFADNEYKLSPTVSMLSHSKSQTVTGTSVRKLISPKGFFFFGSFDPRKSYVDLKTLKKKNVDNCTT